MASVLLQLKCCNHASFPPSPIKKHSAPLNSHLGSTRACKPSPRSAAKPSPPTPLLQARQALPHQYLRMRIDQLFSIVIIEHKLKESWRACTLTLRFCARWGSIEVLTPVNDVLRNTFQPLGVKNITNTSSFSMICSKSTKPAWRKTEMIARESVEQLVVGLNWRLKLCYDWPVCVPGRQLDQLQIL